MYSPVPRWPPHGTMGAVSAFVAVTAARTVVMPFNYPFDTVRQSGACLRLAKQVQHTRLIPICGIFICNFFLGIFLPNFWITVVFFIICLNNFSRIRQNSAEKPLHFVSVHQY